MLNTGVVSWITVRRSAGQQHKERYLYHASISCAGEWQGREVAVKVLCSQDNREANFEGLSEYLVSKQVRHPNVVRPFAHG